MRIVLALITLIGVAGGSGLYVMRGDTKSEETAIAAEMLYTVARGKLRVTIVENGELMAQNSVKVTPESRRGGTITWLIEEGKKIEEGELLAELDTTELEERKAQLDLEIVRTEADLDTARTELDIQRSENDATIEKAKLALGRAEQELEKYTQGDAPKERRELEIDIKDKETAFERAQKKYDDSLRLLKDDYITRSQAEQDRIDFERAQVQLVSAQRNLELFEKYTFPLTLLDKETAVKDAHRELDNAEKRAKSMLRQKEVAVESQEARLKQQQDQLKETVDQIAQCSIKAPVPGIVLYGDPDEPWYRNEIKIGGRIWGGVTLFTIPDLRVMQVKIQVHEADINKLKEGQPATVTMDTYPGLVLTGKVGKIASIAGSGAMPWERNDEVKRFAVNITLDTDPTLSLRPGISAKAEVFIQEMADVISVPIQCVFLQGGNHYAYRLDRSGQPERVKVEPGMSSANFIEIISGLEEGDQVLLYNPRLQEGELEEEDDEAAATDPAADDGSFEVGSDGEDAESAGDATSEDAAAADGSEGGTNEGEAAEGAGTPAEAAAPGTEGDGAGAAPAPEGENGAAPAATEDQPAAEPGSVTATDETESDDDDEDEPVSQVIYTSEGGSTAVLSP